MPVSIVEDTDYPFRDTITLTVNPARLLKIDAGTLSPGASADITLIDPNLEWTVNAAAGWQYLFPLAVAGVLVALALVARRHRGPLAAFLFFAAFFFASAGASAQIPGLPPIPGFPKCFFPNLAFTLCRGGILPRCGGDKE